MENGIKFITSTNSTHLCQLLDVAVFRSVKWSWKLIPESWRKESRSKGCIPKENFPSLFNKLLNTLKGHNLVSGFSGTGLYPLDRRQVPKEVARFEPRHFRGSECRGFLTVLKENMGVGTEKVVSGRKRGMKCVPGKRITNESLTTPDSSLTIHHQNDGEKSGPSSQVNRKNAKKKFNNQF